MRGKAGYTEATGDRVSPEMWVSGDPQPQTFGQHLRLLRPGFGHENDELVAPIARHHVRLPGLLLQQSANSGQHQVAFKMAHGVIHFFKFVEIDQDYREWPSRARSALPLGRQGLPEEAPRLDSCQTVGNGLLLQLLEHESVMQSGGQQVCQSIKNKNILR